jgi:hypothetical protein
MWLHQRIHLFIGQIEAVMDKRLPHLIEGRIVQVFGLEGRFVNQAVARVTAIDTMLFN